MGHFATFFAASPPYARKGSAFSNRLTQLCGSAAAVVFVTWIVTLFEANLLKIQMKDSVGNLS